MIKKNLVLFLLFFWSFAKISAQPVVYEKGYFRYPLDVQRKLNANFGEMRPNHFHMGLDLFTLRQENIPVIAAADGYISKIKIETGGFGNAIYIAHPNGTTTLYAHMNGFYPALARYIREQQYKLESWSIDIDIPKGVLSVKQGDFIGPSGNTGASQGPHVHFEIRETATDKCLNPLLFGFPIPDAVPPQIHRIAIYDRRKSIYEQSPILVPVTRVGAGQYRASIPRLNTDLVQIAIQATDQMSGVPNQNGIYKTILKANGKNIAGFTIDRISYDETRYLNAHIDHRFKASGGAYLQFLNPLKGDKLAIYPYTKPGAAIPVQQGKPLDCSLEVYDSDGNRSELNFTLESNGVNGYYPTNNLVMRADEANVFENELIEVYVPEGAIYDSINFRYSKLMVSGGNAYSAIHQLHDPKIPVHGGLKVRIRPEIPVPYELRDKMLIRLKTNTRTYLKKANWSVDKFGAEFRDFGSFQLIADDQPPVVSGISNGQIGSRITAFVKDNNGVIKKFRGEIDGKWVMFVPRGANYTYVVDERCPPGEHILKISVEDEAGNKTVQQYKITR